MPDQPATDPIDVRPARPEDRDAVVAFCANTWEYSDYIPHVWDAWLRDERGALLVAVVDDRPAGVVHIRMLSADEAWLEGIRVDPAVRRQGIGRVLTSRALVAARERGAIVARLLTGHDNVPSQQLVARFGFSRVAEVVRYQAPALTAGEDESDESGEADDTDQIASPHIPPIVPPGPRLIFAGLDDFERVWGWLEHSNLVPASGGLEFGDWVARALTEPLLREHLGAGRVWLLEEWETIQALAIPADVPARRDELSRLHVRYMDGAADAIGRLALVLREEAGLRGHATVDLWLPDLLILRDAMDGAGYNAGEGGAMWVYARTL
jgi:ribosomal protein S18 acetylase RimI-like enzyme